MSLEIYIREDRSGYGAWYDCNCKSIEKVLEEVKNKVITQLKDNEDLIEAIKFDFDNECLELSIEDVDLKVDSERIDTWKYNLNRFWIGSLLELNEKIENFGRTILEKIDLYEDYTGVINNLLEEIENINENVEVLEQGQSLNSDEIIIGDYLISNDIIKINSNEWFRYVDFEQLNKDFRASYDIKDEITEDNIEEFFNYETIKDYFDYELIGSNYDYKMGYRVIFNKGNYILGYVNY